MLIRKRLLAGMGCQQRRPCFLQRQAPAVARHRDETHITRTGVERDLVEQAPDTDAPPALRAVKATRTIQRRLQFITRRNKLVVGEVARHGDSAAKREPPGLHIQRARLVGDPALGGEGVSSVAAALVLAGEARPGTAHIQPTLPYLLAW